MIKWPVKKFIGHLTAGEEGCTTGRGKDDRVDEEAGGGESACEDLQDLSRDRDARGR